jgi:large subunit ribosomal protein L10
MKLADLESREVLLAKLAGAMKGSLAKAARTFDALRIKLEASAPAPVAQAAPAAEVVAEVSEPVTNIAESEVPAEAVNSEDVAVTPATDETPAE